MRVQKNANWTKMMIFFNNANLTLSRAALIIAFIPRGQGFDAHDIRA